MKIIGHADNAKIIVEMTKRELANITGHTDTLDKWGESWNNEIPCQIGKVYEVGPIFRHLVALSNSMRELAGARKTIEAVASLLELPPSLVEIFEAVEADRRDGR